MRARGLQRQVGCHVSRAPALAGNLCRCRAEFLFCARRQKHGGAFFCKKMSDGPADSTAGACDQGNAILEFHREKEDRVNSDRRQVGRRGIRLQSAPGRRDDLAGSAVRNPASRSRWLAF